MSWLTTAFSLLVSPVTNIINKYQDRKIVEIESGVAESRVRADIIKNEPGNSWRSKTLRLFAFTCFVAIVYNGFIVPWVAYLFLVNIPIFILPPNFIDYIFISLAGYIGLEKMILRK